MIALETVEINFNDYSVYLVSMKQDKNDPWIEDLQDCKLRSEFYLILEMKF